MSNLNLPNLHVLALERALERAHLPRRGNYELKLAYQTFARKIGDVVNIRHHSTIIAMIGSYSVTVRNGGYNSVTTSARIDKVLTDNHIPYRCSIKRGRMMLRHADSLKVYGEFNSATFVMVSGLWTVGGVN